MNPEWLTPKDERISTWLLNNTGIDIVRLLPHPWDFILISLGILFVFALYLAWFTNIRSVRR